MGWVTWIGALLVICGVLLMARVAIFRGRLSDPHSSPPAGRTLEPTRSGITAFSLAANWPGLALIIIGCGMLLASFAGFSLH